LHQACHKTLGGKEYSAGKQKTMSVYCSDMLDKINISDSPYCEEERVVDHNCRIKMEVLEHSSITVAHPAG
jgi:hypothetical protein